MKNPAVFIVTLIISLLALTPEVSLAVELSELEANARRAACGTTPARPGYLEAMKRTWESADAKPPGVRRRDCAARALDADACCKAGGGDFTTACEARLLSANGGTPVAPDKNPFDERGDELIPPEAPSEGAREKMVRSKAAHKRASQRSDRMAGMCKAFAKACDAACGEAGSSAGDKAKCTAANTQSDQMCSNSTAEMVASNGIDPSRAASNPPPGPGGGPSPGPGGGSPSSGSPGGAPTQKPQSAGGQNPMGDLAKALQAAMQKPPEQPKQDNNTAQNQTCESNPSLAGCPIKQPESDSWNKKTAEGEFKETPAAEAGGENFNVAGGENLQPAGYTGNGGEQKFGTPAASNPIPNGGGQIPGGGGGTPAAGGGTAGGGGMAQKAATDIMHGMMAGGGYSAMNAGMQMQNGTAGGGFSGYGAQGGDGYKPGMDLRQFLPGGKSDPTRKLAGGASSFQIQPQTVNIWNRISERFRARCTQGLLRDCN